MRQLRLREIGGIIVIDFIDMVLESNRDLVLRRLTEALARDRTRHQVSEVTSLGLVQLTRKKLGTGPGRGVLYDLSALQRPGHLLHGDPLTPGSTGPRKAESGWAAGQAGQTRGKCESEAGAVAKVPVASSQRASDVQGDGRPTADTRTPTRTRTAGDDRRGSGRRRSGHHREQVTEIAEEELDDLGTPTIGLV